MGPADSGLAALQAFDAVADAFDGRYENDTTRRLRASLYEIISGLVRPGASLLDISCGTGIDAIELAKRGYRITASDVAPRMVEQAEAKASKMGIENIRFHVGSMESLEEVAGAPFDLVLTNFGAVNCLRDMTSTARAVARLTRPGGIFLAVVMPRVSPWEIVAGLARGDSGFAFRRFGRDVTATGFGEGAFPVYYHSLASLRNSFDRWFTLEQARSWGLFSPPPHATRFVQQFPRLSRTLVAVDDALSSMPVLRGMGDHYLCVFKRRTEIAE